MHYFTGIDFLFRVVHISALTGQIRILRTHIPHSLYGLGHTSFLYSIALPTAESREPRIDVQLSGRILWALSVQTRQAELGPKKRNKWERKERFHAFPAYIKRDLPSYGTVGSL